MNFDYDNQPGKYLFNRDVVKNGEPLITIITPYYNGKEYMEQTFNCVMNQSFPWFEWIIVNDGSTNPEDIDYIEDVAKRDERITLLHKENGGPASARNFGVARSKTKYFLPLDCDDLIEATYLEYCWWMLEKNPGAAWSYADSVGFQGLEYTWKVRFNPIKLKEENLSIVASMIKKEAFEAVGGYEVIGKYYHEDWALYLRLVAKGFYPAQSQNDFLFWYRRRDNGVFANVEKKDQKDNFNKKIINELADKVISPHEGVVFPRKKEVYVRPNLSSWDRSVFCTHRKKHFLIITAWLAMGGADLFNLELLEGLKGKDYEVGVITTVRNEDNPWQQRFREITPDVFNLPNFMEPKDYAEFVSYYIKSREVDIVMITNSYYAYYLAPWLRMNFPHIIIVDYVHSETWYWRNGGYARISSAINCITEKTYVCNSALDALMKKDFCRKNNVKTVYIGVDKNKFNPNAIRSGIIYNKYHIAKNRPIIVFVCRLHPDKRPLMMIDIAKRVKRHISNVAFVIVGDGPLKAKMESKVENLDLEHTVYFVGAKNEVRPFYKDAKLTLICSKKEGLSLTAYESCAMGIPVISADVGGQKDLIDETNGALIEFMQDERVDDYNYSEEELNNYTDAIVSYLTDEEKWKNASAKAREKIEKKFSIEKMIETFEQEFEVLLSDDILTKKRIQTSDNLSQFKELVCDYAIVENIVEGEEYVFDGVTNDDIYSFEYENGFFSGEVNKIKDQLMNHEEVLNRHEEVVNRHEEVVNRHEEVVNRHEEVVNRHEQVVNDDWAWLKSLESRYSNMYNSIIFGIIRKIKGR